MDMSFGIILQESASLLTQGDRGMYQEWDHYYGFHR